MLSSHSFFSLAQCEWAFVWSAHETNFVIVCIQCTRTMYISHFCFELEMEDTEQEQQTTKDGKIIEACIGEHLCEFRNLI